jgi:predicted transcriptional regulator
MSTLSELTVQVLTARLAKKEMSLEELQKEMLTISSMLKGIDEGTLQEPAAETVEEPKPQKINLKKVFKENEVRCLLCNKGFKTLKRHLNMIHQISDKEYKAQFGIPAKQVLAAKSYSDQKKAFALEHKLGDKMQAGRKAQLEKSATPVEVVTEVTPEVAEVKAPVPAKRVKPAVPAVRKKAPVPAKTTKATPKPKI